MKNLKCADVTGKTCAFEAHGESIEEVKKLLAEHGMQAHPELTENASEEDKKMMDEKMEKSVTDAE